MKSSFRMYRTPLLFHRTKNRKLLGQVQCISKLFYFSVTKVDDLFVFRFGRPL